MARLKLKWGVAGLGHFAENSFIPSVAMMRKSSIGSVFSSSHERGKQIAEKFGIPEYYSSYDQFLKSDINAVYISSANVNHYPQVIKAAEAGKNILCEKPLALNSAQAEEMVNACKANQVLLCVNYIYRFHPLIRKVKELISSRMIGKIVAVNTSFNMDFPPGENFRFRKSLSGGGVLRDLGTHMIDILRFFGGEITEIKGNMDNIIYKSEVEDFAAAIVKFRDSGYGYFNVSFNCRKAFNRINILGHLGAISIEKVIGVKNAPARLSILLEGEAKKAFRKRGNRMVYMLRSVQKSFLKNEEPAATGYDGYINLKLMEELERQNNYSK
jgi:predicted dehydrogenase